MNEIPMTFYHDPSEQLRGVLGQNYVTSIISERKLKKSLMVLTNRRLYQTGKVFEKGLGNTFNSSAGKKIISVKDITGTSYKENNKLYSVIAGWMCLVPAVIFGLCGIDTGQTAPIIVSVVSIAAGLVLWMDYYMCRTRWFILLSEKTPTLVVGDESDSSERSEDIK